MSVEAARIIESISRRKNADGNKPMLGTVRAVAPLTINFDNVGFDIESGLLVNSLLLDHKKTDTDLSESNVQDACIKEGLTVGDRVVGMAVDGAQYIIFCRVVSV